MKILQIIPADGWKAIYDFGDSLVEYPLVCFALVEELSESEPYEYICGIVVNGFGFQLANALGQFVTYLSPNQSVQGDAKTWWPSATSGNLTSHCT